MTFKEMLRMYTVKDLVKAMEDMGIYLYDDDHIKMTEICYATITSRITKAGNGKIVLKKSSNGFPMVVREFPAGNTSDFLCCYIDFANCEVINKTECEMSNVTMVCYVLLHLMAFELGEVPYAFLRDRFEASEEDDD